MSLLRDIQDAAIDGATDLSTLLRKCKVLAARLDHDQFGRWVEWELNGYPEDAELPPYRIFRNVQSIGDFSGAFGSGLRNQPLPIMNLPEGLQEYFAEKQIRDGIAACAEWAQAEGNLAAPWPPDIIVQVNDRFFEGMSLMAARVILPTTLFVGLVDAVRNRLLGFVLEIERLAPDAGEAVVGEQLVEKEMVTQVFNTNIYGAPGNVAIGNKQANQAVAEMRVEQGDADALRRSLSSLGVDDDSVRDLLELLKDLEPTKLDKEPPQGIKSWIADMAAKGARGVWTSAVPEATRALVQVVYGFLGLDSE